MAVLESLRYKVVRFKAEVKCISLTPGDETALADALEQLWRSPSLRSSLGNSAREKILQNHSWERVLDKILFFCQG